MWLGIDLVPNRIRIRIGTKTMPQLLISCITAIDWESLFFSESLFKSKETSSSVADPDPRSGAFLTPGSGIGFSRIPDP